MLSMRRTVFVIGLGLAPLAYSEEPPMDQVVVEATRTNLNKLAKEVRQSEKRFYKRYNELNKVRDYAIKCSTEATTGTRFTRTDCQPVFESKAEEAEARQFLVAFGGGEQITGPGGITGPPHMYEPDPPPMVGTGSVGPAAATIAARRPGFKQHMMDVTTQNPELVKMAEEHAALWKRYEAMYRKLNGAGPDPEDEAEAP